MGSELIDFSSAWPIGVILALILAIAATPMLTAADAPPTETPSRVESLDGLRGFLALAVFFSHTLIYHRYLLGAPWGLTSFPLFTMLGETGVAVFFMITGYLFWSQLLAKGGKPDWVRLYVGRLFRILPLYWFAVGLVIIGVVLHTGPHLNVAPSHLVAQLAQWAAGGLRQETPINGYAGTAVLIAGVTWTLGYEWKFYAALLPLSPLARARGILRWAPLPALLCLLVFLFVRTAARPGADPWVCSALFLSGMSVASLGLPKMTTPGAIHAASAIVLAAVITVFLVFRDVFAALPIAVLAGCFFLVVSGATGFGLLRSLPARRLGNISFGIYLLQGPVLAASFMAPAVRTFALSSPWAHWAVMGADGVALVIFAAAAHALIERPGIALGKKFAGRLGRLPRLRPLGSPAPGGRELR